MSVISQINIAEVAKNLHELSMKKSEKTKERSQHIRFKEVHDAEILYLLNLFGNLTALWSAIKHDYGDKFEKRCRDRFNNYINKHEFTQEEDQYIISECQSGMSYKFIGKEIGVKAKQIQNRYGYLIRRPMPDPPIISKEEQREACKEGGDSLFISEEEEQREACKEGGDPPFISEEKGEQREEQNFIWEYSEDMTRELTNFSDFFYLSENERDSIWESCEF
jgi:hypothetical protein